MQHQAIIQVKVQVKKDGPEVFTYGVAYWINQIYTITALHVVEEYKAITFFFSDGSKTNDFHLDYKKESYDIALISFPGKKLYSPPEVCTPQIKKIKGHDKWSGVGYPKYAEHGNERERETFKGTCKPYLEDNNFIQIQCDEEPSCKDWGGVSGSPVFDINENLVAVIIAIDEIVKNTQFQASAIWKLLADEEFVNCYYLRSSSSVYYEEKLRELLAKYTGLKDELIDSLSASNESVLNELLKQEKQEIMDMCLSLQKSRKNLEGINELLLYAMAYQYENNDCLRQELTSEKPYIDVPVVRVEACEFLMASADQRVPLFRKETGKSGKQEVIPGKYSIVAPPEYGIESSAHEDIMDNLMAGHGDCDSLVERVFGDYRRASGRVYSKQQKEKVVVAMLEKSEGTYYWLLQVSDGNRSELKKLFNSLPIKILNMAQDPDVQMDMAEETLFSKLGDFVKD